MHEALLDYRDRQRGTPGYSTPRTTNSLGLQAPSETPSVPERDMHEIRLVNGAEELAAYKAERRIKHLAVLRAEPCPRLRAAYGMLNSIESST